MNVASFAAIRQTAGILNLPVDFPAYSRHRFRSRILHACQLRLTTLARSKAVLFGCRRKKKKAYLLAARPTRRAGRFAINSCGTHRVNEIAVSALVVGLDSLPAGFLRLAFAQRRSGFFPVSTQVLG